MDTTVLNISNLSRRLLRRLVMAVRQRELPSGLFLLFRPPWTPWLASNQAGPWWNVQNPPREVLVVS